MPSLYSCLAGVVRPYCDTMTAVLMMALSQAGHAPGDSMPHIPGGYGVHADEVLKRYTSDKIQAIHRTISCQTLCEMKLEPRHLIGKM